MGKVELDENDLETYDWLEKRLNAPKGSLYAWVSRGEIPHVRINKRTVRFSKTAIEAFLANRKVEAK